MAPHHLFVLGVHPLIVLVVRLLAALHRREPAFEPLSQASGDVADLALEHEDDASHDGVGIRAIETEEAGELRNRDPKIGAGIFAPQIMQLRPAP